MGEEWRDVVGYEGIYEVSNKGQIRTKEGKTTKSKRDGRIVERQWKQRTLRQKIGTDNSCRVSLWKDGKEYYWLVHRIVALAFIPLEEGRDHINHKDGNRLNNDVRNLEWCTPKENNNHAFDNRLIRTGRRTILREKATGKELHFRSMAKASQFLGRSSAFIHSQLNAGRTEYKGYEIAVCD